MPSRLRCTTIKEKRQPNWNENRMSSKYSKMFTTHKYEKIKLKKRNAWTPVPLNLSRSYTTDHRATDRHLHESLATISASSNTFSHSKHESWSTQWETATQSTAEIRTRNRTHSRREERETKMRDSKFSQLTKSIMAEHFGVVEHATLARLSRVFFFF